MDEEINQVIEEKFTRCPECRSFSVKQTMELTQKERIKAYFVPVKVHRCDNCSYRFVEYESFLTSLKYLIRSPGKCLVIAAPVVVAAAILVTIILMTGGNEKEPEIPTGKKPIHTLEKKPETKIEEKKEIKKPQQRTPGENQEVKPVTPAITGVIILGRSNRFGVNWRPLGEGVQITRLSPGAVKRAGLLRGDILLEVDGKKVIGEGMELELARDDVFYGKRTEVLIKVLRGEETLFFKMIKRKK